MNNSQIGILDWDVIINGAYTHNKTRAYCAHTPTPNAAERQICTTCFADMLCNVFTIELHSVTVSFNSLLSANAHAKHTLAYIEYERRMLVIIQS